MVCGTLPLGGGGASQTEKSYSALVLEKLKINRCHRSEGELALEGSNAEADDKQTVWAGGQLPSRIVSGVKLSRQSVGIFSEE